MRKWLRCVSVKFHLTLGRLVITLRFDWKSSAERQ